MFILSIIFDHKNNKTPPTHHQLFSHDVCTLLIVQNHFVVDFAIKRWWAKEKIFYNFAWVGAVLVAELTIPFQDLMTLFG